MQWQNEQLLDHLHADLQFESENVAKDVKSVHSVVSQALSADDRALAELNDLATRRTKSTVDTSDIGQRLAQLTSALQHFRVQAVKDHLDCTYLRSLNDLYSPEGEKSPQDPAVPSATVKEIQHDLGLLYSEIDDVVTMTVRHEHTGPIEASLHQIDAAREMEGRAVGRQVCVYALTWALCRSCGQLFDFIILNSGLLRVWHADPQATLISHAIARAAIVNA